MLPLCLFLTLQSPSCYVPAGLRSHLAGGRGSTHPLLMQEGRPRPVGPKWRGPESTQPAAREALGVAHVFEQKLAALEGKSSNPCCAVCWLPEHVCCCSALGAQQRHALQRLQDLRPVKICLYMHVKEFARKSNTGSLIKCARPLVDTNIFISGLPEHDAELQRQIQELGPTRCCAVFPSMDSKSVREFIAAANQQSPSFRKQGDDCAVNAEAAQPMLAIFVEGSWDQARRLNKRLPADLPRVSLDLVQHYSGERQEAGEQDNRMNTLLAISHFLRELWTLGVQDQSGTASLLIEADSAIEIMQKFLYGLILEKEQVSGRWCLPNTKSVGVRERRCCIPIISDGVSTDCTRPSFLPASPPILSLAAYHLSTVFPQSLTRLHGGKARHPERPVLDQKRRRRFSNL